VGQRSVCNAESVVQINRLSCSCFCLSERVLCWNHSPASEHDVGIRDACMSHRVFGAQMDRLLVMGDAIAHALLRALVPGMTPPEIRLVCLGRNRGGLPQGALAARRQLDLNFRGDRASDFTLELQDVPEAARIALRPNVRFIVYTDQLCGDSQLASGTPHTAGQYVVHAQFSADMRNALFRCFEHHGRGPGDYT
jgi:hypothetical protein